MKAVRNVREPLKKPRPLKTTASSEQIIKLHANDPKETVVQKSTEAMIDDLEILNVSISNCNFDEVTVADISRMCAILKKRGEELDSKNKDAMDRYFCTLRNASREEKLDIVSRLKLLETIELRARNWKKNDNINNYFSMKIAELEQGNADGLLNHSLSSTSISFSSQNQNVSPVPGIPLQHGEVLRSSGKFTKPTKIAGKNYFKDEIVIRNSDSGKVNPGARDRLVQITGPHEDAIGHAKVLVEDTIRRNASPLRENCDPSGLESNQEHSMQLDNQPFAKKNLQHSYSLGDATLKEFSYPLHLGQEVITLTGTNSDLIKTARLVLKEFFASQSELQEKHGTIRHLNRQQSPDDLTRYELKRQSSLRSSLEHNYSSNWMNNRRKDSISTLSSSDDDVLKDDRRNVGPDESTEQVQDISPRVTMSSATNSFKSQSTDVSNSRETFSRSSSVPTDFSDFTTLQQNGRDEVFSPLLSPSSETPPIPPPSCRKKQTYSRDFLLKCAKSHFSQTQPTNYAHIHQNFEDIISQSPVMFDPAKYESPKASED